MTTYPCTQNSTTNLKSKTANTSSTSSKEEKPPDIGNFALPASQQISGLISFGQRIIGKDVAQLTFFADDRIGHKQYFIDTNPVIDYGVSDTFTVTFIAPYAARFKDINLNQSTSEMNEPDQDTNESSAAMNDSTTGISQHSSGIQDIILQGEYAFVSNTTSQYSDQATIIANVSFPTGTATKTPPTGFGTLGVFTGLTFSKTYIDWYFFSSHGVNLHTKRHGTQFGNSFLYQFGFGKNISYITNKMIFSWLVEVDGTYSARNKIRGITDPNSGGNLVYLTPSLWLSFQKFYVQFGVGWAVTQHLQGLQNKYTYSASGNLVWTF